ncbi:hypothetical protein SDC9_60560 [bioreactor metagenome]|uniref:Uncharacterized protein n=1 Tax=bioreactor metagenome TaxID=1076179 RepID=A0A644XD95_9ZZZZ
MLSVDFRRFDPHGRIEEYGNRFPENPLILEKGELVEDPLGPVHDETGDKDLPLVFQYPGEDVPKFIPGLGIVPVEPVPVGGFHDHVVGVRNNRRVSFHDRFLGAEVAAEDDFYFFFVFGEPDFEDCAPEDVSCIPKPDGDSGGHGYPVVVAGGRKVADRLVHVLGTIERLHGVKPFSGILLRLPFSLFFHEVGGIIPEHFHKFEGGEGGEDLSLEPLLHKERYPAGVVHVGMGEENRVKASCSEGEGFAVFSVVVLSLENAAVYEHPAGSAFDEVAGSGHFSGGANDFKYHRKFLLLNTTLHPIFGSHRRSFLNIRHDAPYKGPVSGPGFHFETASHEHHALEHIGKSPVSFHPQGFIIHVGFKSFSVVLKLEDYGSVLPENLRPHFRRLAMPDGI